MYFRFSGVDVMLSHNGSYLADAKFFLILPGNEIISLSFLYSRDVLIY